MPGRGGGDFAPARDRCDTGVLGRRPAPSESQRRLPGGRDGRGVGRPAWRSGDLRGRGARAPVAWGGMPARERERYRNRPQDAVGADPDCVRRDGRRTPAAGALMDEIAFDRSHGGAHLGAALIDFSVSTNPFGPPPRVLEAYHRADAALGSYPEPYAASLTAAIADHLGVAPGNVLAG